MNKLFLSVLLTLLTSLTLSAQVVKFKGSYAEALAEAKKTNKMLFFMGSASW